MYSSIPVDIFVPKISFKKLALMLVLILVDSFLLTVLIQRPLIQVDQMPAVSNMKPAAVRPGLPVRLKIPKLNVDAAIDYVGLTSSGDLGIPKGPANTGWYESGPRPGELGSSVIDGHFGMADNKPAVFDNLHTLQKGDVLQVEDEKGVTVSFIVTGSRQYGPDEDATAVFRTDDGKARLNLITCQGSWNAGQDSYATRLVVFSIKE